MKSSAELKKDILAIDHRGYPGYKGLRGRYQFKDHVLSIDRAGDHLRLISFVGAC